MQKEVLDKIAALITGVSGFVAAILYAVIVTIIIADRLQCSAGQQVRIMMTNLGRGDLHLKKDSIPWMIKNKNGEKIYTEVLTERYWLRLEQLKFIK
ncbi:MAG: hypothetical protein M3275_01930 [Thermoproteota archaeon]|nr:hypothetical protein [Thermoproteota archaeon]